jgi:hypothetical protein
VVAGVGAAVVSLVQCALGLVLAGWAVPDGDTGRARLLFAAVNRLDGIKMLALAAWRRPAKLHVDGAGIQIAVVRRRTGAAVLVGLYQAVAVGQEHFGLR